MLLLTYTNDNKQYLFSYYLQEKIAKASFVIGMAGSGKTTFVKVFSEQDPNVFTINIDPAVLNIPYQPRVDIRDSINYQQLMTNNKLGPNGAILTALNLFCSRIDQLLDLLQQKMIENPNIHFVFDAPGQIESFIWSASGEILIQSLMRICPVTTIYIVDGAKCVNPRIYVSSMIYMLSIVYRLNLHERLLVIFNKIDLVVDAQVDSSLLEKLELEEEATSLDLLKKFNDTKSYSLFNAFDMEDCGFFDTVATQLQNFWVQETVVYLSCMSGFGYRDLLNKLENVFLLATNYRETLLKKQNVDIVRKLAPISKDIHEDNPDAVD